MNFCRSCGEDFASVEYFDAHRVGSWGERRCLPVERLTEFGFELDSRGRWTNPTRSRRARSNFTGARTALGGRARRTPRP